MTLASVSDPWFWTVIVGASVALGAVAPHRGMTRPALRDRAIVVVTMGGLLLVLWNAVELFRPYLLPIPALAILSRFVRLRPGWWRTSILVASGACYALLALQAVSAMLWFGFSRPVVATAISPNGKWEAQLVDDDWMHESHGVVVVPRGLVTLNPFAYPSRQIRRDGMGSPPGWIRWRADGTIETGHGPRPPETPSIAPRVQ